ncbi:MAG: tetratricopeptide repeat protein [Anaerolineae bacterium]|nr:tetratricopeptide repeat protein [Anaerolineae bacterium]
MDTVTTTPSVQLWPNLFRQLVITNSRHWLNCAQNDPEHFAQETSQVLRALNYGLPLPEAWESVRDLIIHLSPLMIRRGQGIEWEPYLLQGIKRSTEQQDPAEIKFRLHLGNLYRLQGRLPEAHDTLQTGVNLCGHYDTQTHYWALLNLLALVARLSGHHEEALAHCQKALDTSQSSMAERAEAWNVKGLVAHDQRKWEAALNYFDQAIDLYHFTNNNFEKARTLSNRGMILRRLSRNKEAQETYRMSIDLFQSLGDKLEVNKPITNLGNLYLTKKDYNSAITYYIKALSAFQECNYVVDLAHIYNNLGMAHTGLSNWAIAEEYYTASINAWKNTDNKYSLVNVLDNFGEMFVKAQQSHRAHEIWRQANQILQEAADDPRKTHLQQVLNKRLEK